MTAVQARSNRPILLEWKAQWAKRFEGPTAPHNWVFIHPCYSDLQAQGFRTAFETARKKSGLPDLRPYHLRHYFISHAIMSGIDTFTIAKWSGHKNTRMMEEVYGQRPEFRASQMRKLQIDVGADAMTRKGILQRDQASWFMMVGLRRFCAARPRRGPALRKAPRRFDGEVRTGL